MTSSDTNATAEFVGQIIDIFEDFLDDKGVRIENPEYYEDPNNDPDEIPANIYGSDYGYLQTRIEDTLRNWGLQPEMNVAV